MGLVPFGLPSEAFLEPLLAALPGREQQIRALTTLLSPALSAPRNIVLHGLEATGKSSVISAVLSAFEAGKHRIQDGPMVALRHDTTIHYAVVRSAQCITTRHLFETTVAVIADSLKWPHALKRCENLAQLTVNIHWLLSSSLDQQKDFSDGPQQKFVLVLDGIDQQRDASPTLLPGLARLAEVIPNLSTIFVVKHPRPHFLHISCTAYIDFPAYTKQEVIRILALNPLPVYASEHQSHNPLSSNDIFPRFISALWDSLGKHSGRDVLSIRSTASRLWPQFVKSIREGTHTTKDFSRMLVSQRYLFQAEANLVPSIINSSTMHPASSPAVSNTAPRSAMSTPSKQIIASKQTYNSLTSSLPLISRLLLVSAYLCSHTASKHDALIFSRSSNLRRKKRGGGTMAPRATPGRAKHRKISRKLLGPMTFVLERLMSVFWAVGAESSIWRGMEKVAKNGYGPRNENIEALRGSADVQMAIATLASLRLVVKTSGLADVLDGSTKWRVNVGWDVIRGVGRSIGIEVEEWVVE